MGTSVQNGAPGCPASVLELVARFDLHSETYKQQTYNETQVRREFIDPMFKALGWEIEKGRSLTLVVLTSTATVRERPQRIRE